MGAPKMIAANPIGKRYHVYKQIPAIYSIAGIIN